ncbi:MAG: nuclear transport factor 2 family protein [Steroidobacteraceae bacterium]
MNAENYYHINQLYQRYAHALDARDWKTLAQCYAPDGTFTDTRGNSSQGREAVIEHISRAIGVVGLTQHLTAPPLIQEQGGKVTGTCYVIGQNAASREQNAAKCLVGARYDDELVQRGESWHLLRRKVNPLWFDGSLAVFTPPSK